MRARAHSIPRNPLSIKHLPLLSRCRKLGLFCTIGIGLEYWNGGIKDGCVRTAGGARNWLCFARVAAWERRSRDRHGGENWVCLYNWPAEAQEDRSQDKRPAIGLSPVRNPQSRNWLCLARAGPAASPGLTCRPAPTAGRPAQIGFVLHNPPLGPRQTPALALFGVLGLAFVVTPRGVIFDVRWIAPQANAGNWLCFVDASGASDSS